MTPLEVLQAYVAGNGYEVLGDAVVPMRNEEAEAALVAVRNLIDVAREVADANHDPMRDDIQELRVAVAVVSGQEEPK